MDNDKSENIIKWIGRYNKLNVTKQCGFILDLAIIFTMIVLVFGFISNFNINIFLYDDNYTQWLPVINKTYDDLLTTGKFNIWEMHLMNGINILDTGIYSVLNPIMFVSYIIYKALGLSNTISIYIFLIVFFSMLIFNCIMKYKKICLSDRLAILFCLLGCSSYYKFGHWYYVFNNLFIGSLFLYYFIKVKNKYLKYIFAGGVLGFSVYMGNVQYTLMWYMFFAIVMTVMIIIDDRYHIWIMLCNIIGGIALSLPQLILNARASESSVIFSGKNSGFFDAPLHLSNVLLRGLIPECVIKFLTKSQIEEYYFSKDFYFNGVLMLFFFISLFVLIKKKKWSYFDKLTIAYIVSIVFFVFFTLGEGYIVADILSLLPIINRFRCLYKAYFMLSPLLLALLLFTYDGVAKNIRTKIYPGGVLIAFVNIVHLSVGGFALQNNNDILNQNIADIGNYRVLTMIECSDDNLFESYQYNIQNDIEGRATYNWPGYYNIFTVGGYNLSYKNECYLSVNEIMTDDYMFGEFSYGNAVDVTKWIERYEKGEVDINKWSDQMINNAIRFVMVYYKNDEIINKLVNIINASDFLSVEYAHVITNGCAMLCLRECKGLVYNDDGAIMDVKSIVNGLEINGETSGDLYLSFLYNKHYIAYSTEQGYRENYTIREDKNGYIIIENVAADHIYLEYKDILSYVAIIFAGISTLFLCGILLFNQRKERKGECQKKLIEESI